jgi:hypothetical protein
LRQTVLNAAGSLRQTDRSRAAFPDDDGRFRGRELASLLGEILIVSALIVMVAFWGIVEALIARQERRRRFLRDYPDLDHLHPRSSIWSVPRPPKGKSS